MNLFRRIFDRCADALIGRATRRLPDFVIGGHADPYLLRWWLIPRNRVFNIYLHKFLRDDDDRALHDHPWPWCSILLRGSYVEVTSPKFDLDRAAGIVTFRGKLPKSATITAGYDIGAGSHDVLITARKSYGAGSVRVHRPKFAHRLELRSDLSSATWDSGESHKRLHTWTLFITGPRMREWGFHCPERGWVPWYEFTAPEDAGAIGRGCGEVV